MDPHPDDDTNDELEYGVWSENSQARSVVVAVYDHHA
jgi:hypothetical protein